MSRWFVPLLTVACSSTRCGKGSQEAVSAVGSLAFGGVVSVGTKWREEVSDDGAATSVTGYIHVRIASLGAFLAHGGRHGVFVRQVAMHRDEAARGP
eukprot:11711025-Alexandrium_andersonii.AAC.1